MTADGALQTKRASCPTESRCPTDNKTLFAPNRFLAGDFFKSKLVKAIIFIQIGLTALVALTAVVSLLYAKEMGSEAIWQTLKGLFTVWFMFIVIFGFLPLIICYIRYKLSTKEKAAK